MRILQLIDGGFIGGGQTHVLSLSAKLREDGIESIIAASGEGPFRKAAEDAGIAFTEIELPKIYRGRHLKELDKLIKKADADLLHSHGGVAGMYSGFHMKKFGTVPVVHTIHGIHYINSSNLFRRLLTHSVERHLSAYRDMSVCVSNSDRNIAESLKIILPERTKVIHNGIDVNRFRKRDREKELMAALGIGERDFVIGFISRFDEQKNQEFVIRNSVPFLNKHTEAKLLLAGGGRLLKRCIQLAYDAGISDRVIFTGEIFEVERYYPLFDIFVFPSRWEGLSIALIEAMASGRCILAGNIEANTELINDGINGMLFSLEDAGEFMQKLEILFSDSDLRRRLSARAADDAEKFSSGAMAGQVAAIYRNVFAGRMYGNS